MTSHGFQFHSTAPNDGRTILEHPPTFEEIRSLRRQTTASMTRVGTASMTSIGGNKVSERASEKSAKRLTHPSSLGAGQETPPGVQT